MADQIPTTQKGQIDALLSALGVSDFTAAQAGITQLQANQTNWQGQQQALFAALGGNGNVPDHYDFAGAISGLRTQSQEIISALGATDHASAVTALTNLRSQLNSLNANQTTLFAALGATDLAGAMRAVKDIDGRIEAGVNAGVIARAASAGLPAPVEKVQGDQQPSGAAKSCTRDQWAAMSAPQQLEFSKAGGKVSAE